MAINIYWCLKLRNSFQENSLKFMKFMGTILDEVSACFKLFLYRHRTAYLGAFSDGGYSLVLLVVSRHPARIVTPLLIKNSRIRCKRVRLARLVVAVN